MAILENRNLRSGIIYLLIIFSYYCALSIGIYWDELFDITIGQERLKYIFSFGNYDVAPLKMTNIIQVYIVRFQHFFQILCLKSIFMKLFHLINNTFSIFTIFGFTNYQKYYSTRT